MIRSFRHKGLRRFFMTGDHRGISLRHAARLRMLLAALDTAVELGDMRLPGHRLHPLRGDRKGRWAVSVSGNWRLTFGYHDGDAWDVDIEDYH